MSLCLSSRAVFLGTGSFRDIDMAVHIITLLLAYLSVSLSLVYTLRYESDKISSSLPGPHTIYILPFDPKSQAFLSGSKMLFLNGKR